MTRRLVQMPSRGYWPPHEWPKPPYSVPEWVKEELQRLVPDPGEKPPCKLMKVSFEQLRILEVQLDGFISSWVQRLIVSDLYGTTAQPVTVPIPQHGPVPFEMALDYVRFVRTQPTDIFDILRAMRYGVGFSNSFGVGSGGTIETHLLRAGTSELPTAENIHGGQEGWKTGANVLTASDAFTTYEVTYTVSCAPIIVTELPYARVYEFFSRAWSLRGKKAPEPGPELIRLALMWRGYTVTDDYGDGEKRTLRIEGPSRFDEIERDFSTK